MMNREEGFYWVVLLEAWRVPRWTPAEFFNGEWFFPGIRQALPERKLAIGDRIADPPLPSREDVRQHVLRTRRAADRRKKARPTKAKSKITLSTVRRSSTRSKTPKISGTR